MPMHEHFEELCALAVIGQLCESEHRELVQHLTTCDRCRSAGAEFAFILDQFPAAVSPKIGDDTATLLSDSYRQKFLVKASAEGIRFTEDASWRSSPRSSVWFALHRHRYLGAIAAATVCLSGLATLYGRYFAGDTRNENEIERKSGFAQVSVLQKPAKSELESSSETARVTELEHQIEILKTRQAGLLEDKKRLELDSLRLNQQLQGASAKAESLNLQLGKSEEAVSDANREVDKLKNAQGEILASLSADSIKIKELSQRVADDASALNRERQLNAAAKDIRRLMAARNVHIVDVYDYDTRGKRDKSFGRVVYTENESLIFYAFDLANVDSASKVTFQAWGQREGAETQTRNLGVFNVDDREQRRWVLRVDDPKLLSSIDSVFVTVEPAPGRDKPSGKKLLYAYLGTAANHP